MSRTILVVDDDEQVALSIMSALEGIPELRVIVVRNGQEALCIARDNTFLLSAVITDFDMPLLDGYTLIHELRSLPLYRTIPVLMITADPANIPCDTDVIHHPDQILKKPFSCREVRRFVEEIVVDSSASPSAHTNGVLGADFT